MRWQPGLFARMAELLNVIVRLRQGCVLGRVGQSRPEGHYSCERGCTFVDACVRACPVGWLQIMAACKRPAAADTLY